MVEDFNESAWEVCPDCCQIGHRNGCGNPPRCFLCAGNRDWKDHCCGDCKATRPCKHIPIKCANCKGKHEAVNPSCLVLRGKRKGIAQHRTDTQHRADTQGQGPRGAMTPKATAKTAPQIVPAMSSRQEMEEVQIPVVISSDPWSLSLPSTPTPMEIERETEKKDSPPTLNEDYPSEL